MCGKGVGNTQSRKPKVVCMGDEIPKMKIQAFNDKKFRKPSSIPPFNIQVNPENYKKRVAINYADMQAPGTSLRANKYTKTQRQELTFDFLLDSTGVLGNSPTDTKNVEARIKLFKNLTLDYNGKTHSPRYLILIWGDLLFKCQLKDIDVEYKMFSSAGEAMRAVIKATFIEFVDEKKRQAIENKSSPDLTHRRTVKEGDTLPLMSERIYGDPKHYIQVARTNRIMNFRNLEPGTEIIFPPIEK